MSLFPTDGFVPTPMHYPRLVIIEEQWRQHEQHAIGPDSTQLPHSDGTRDQKNYHAEMTLAVVKAIAPNISPANICRVSFKRTLIKDATLDHLFDKSLPEALASIDLLPTPLQADDIITINVQTLEAAIPVANDKLILSQLKSLSQRPGCLTIVAAGNSGARIDDTTEYPCLIVGGISIHPATSAVSASSNYGPDVSCYFPVPINVPGYGRFDNSSAATAALTGIAMLVHNYCRSRAYPIKATDLLSLFRHSGKSYRFGTGSDTAIVPDWLLLKQELDRLFQK